MDFGHSEASDHCCVCANHSVTLVIRRHLLDDIDKVIQGHRVVTAAWKAQRL